MIIYSEQGEQVDLMAGLLYPAYQKFYSALCSLERFNKEANFFDNISCIDSFFSEYRNITFALQASLKHTEYFCIYEKNRDEYLTDHWFVEKRNETTKQQPFQLVKEITTTIYLPFDGFSVDKRVFTVENDMPLETLFADFEQLFNSFNIPEIMFSVTFAFHESGSNIDLLSKLFSGISSMQMFMDNMEREIGEDCPLCNQIKDKIDRMSILMMPTDFFIVNDYVYYKEIEQFERGERISAFLSFDGKNGMKGLPLSSLTESDVINFDGTPFGNFSLMHSVLRAENPDEDIMPTFFIIYEDRTYDIDTFHADIKTTMYRKINEIAEKIKKENIVEICYTSLYATLPLSENVPDISKERVKLSSEDVLVCASIDKDLNEQEYVFDGEKMVCPTYIGYVLQNEKRTRLLVSRINLFPIWRAFNNKLERTTDNN